MKRLRNLGGHVKNVGRELDSAVEAYNKAVGSLESRVMVSARRFAELGAPVTEEIAELTPIEKTTRNLTFEFDDPENPETSPDTEPAGKTDVEAGRKALSASKASD